jgi:hypothetical protein
VDANLVRVSDVVDADSLYVRFELSRSLDEAERERLTSAVAAWYDQAFDRGEADYVDVEQDPEQPSEQLFEVFLDFGAHDDFQSTLGRLWPGISDNLPITGVHVTSDYIDRDQVIAAYQGLVARGFAHPDELPLDDPEMQRATEMEEAWGGLLEGRAHTAEEKARCDLSRYTVLVDAGFRDPEFLDEVANDWLVNTLAAAEEAGLTDVVTEILAKTAEINQLIAASPGG